MMLRLEKAKWEKRISDKLELAATTGELELVQESLKKGHLDSISNLTNLTSLNIYSCVSLHTKLRFVSSLVNLQLLFLYGAKLDDDDLNSLSNLTKLVKLDLTHNNITGRGFAHLNCPNIKSLTMIGNPMNYEGVSILCRSFSSLESFNFMADESSVCEKCGPSVGCHKHKTQSGGISLNLNDFDNDCLVELSKLPNLKKLILSKSRISDYGPLASCSNLEYLSLFESDNEDFDKSNLLPFPVLAQIQTLIVSRFFSKIILPEIHLFTSLENLDIRCLPDSNIVLLPKLKTLCLADNNELESSSLAFVKDLCNLERLDLRYQKNLDENLLEYLKDLPSLIFVNIVGSKITQDTIDDFKNRYNPHCEFFIG